MTENKRQWKGDEGVCLEAGTQDKKLKNWQESHVES